MIKKPINKSIIGFFLVVLLALGSYLLPRGFNFLPGSFNASSSKVLAENTDGVTTLIKAVAANKSGVWFAETPFEVVKILSDDREGSQHQRLLVARSELPTLLIAHNIDLAERVPVSQGDTIFVRGRYEWNEKGGVIHWTHHDPKNKSEGGWIRYANKKYF